MALSRDPEFQSIPPPEPYSKKALSKVAVFPLIHIIRKDVEANIDTALTWSQMTSPEVNFMIVRPLVLKYVQYENPAIVYAALVVRSNFQSLADDDLAYSSIISTRASLCELLALKLLRHFTNTQIELATVLTNAWNPLQSAPNAVIEQVKVDIGGDHTSLNDPMNALEVAIATDSKEFLSSPLVQNIVNDIWQGHIIFTSASAHALVQDNYKSRELEIYDARNTPFLDHYRLRVPRYRSIMESINFIVLFVLFVACLTTKNLVQMGWAEIFFIVFLFGFILDEFAATQEHGWAFYIANMWNGFDLAFICIFWIYFGLRIKGLRSHDLWYSDLAFDILACGACLLFPRLAFLPVQNNVVILALRGMIADFVYFISIAAICFSGVLYTLHNLAGDSWPVKKIAWLMVQIWFGNTYLSFQQAESFHPIFGPILMTCFAALSNTLLITILISILSATFARINEHASQEFLFQFTISTLEGVKSDAVLAYQPPFNLVAYVILTALSWVISPRTLHTVNVFLIRLTAFPMLVVIGVYERYVAPTTGLIQTSKGAASAFFAKLPRHIRGITLVDAFIGSNSKDLLSAVLRAEYEVDHDDPFTFEHLSAPGVGSDDDDNDNTYKKQDDDYNLLGPPKSSNGGAASTSDQQQQQSQSQNTITPTITTTAEDPDDPQAQLRRRGRYISAASTQSPRTPSTPRRRPGADEASLASPLARSFSVRPLSMAVDTSVGQDHQRLAPHTAGPGGFGGGRVARADVDDVLKAVRKLESGLADKIEGVTHQRDELKELAERQARIETLLLSLTRGMRD